MFPRFFSLAALALFGNLALASGPAAAAQCTTSATPVCARTSCSIKAPFTCTCREWKCVERGGRGTAIGAASSVQKQSKPARK